MELFWHQAPLVRVLLPFLFGILLGIQTGDQDRLSFEIPVVAALLIVLLLTLGFYWKKFGINHFFGVTSSVLFIILGYFAISLKLEQHGSLDLSFDHYYAVVESRPSEKPNSYSLNLKLIKGFNGSDDTDISDAKIIGYVPKSFKDQIHSITPGHLIKFSGDISLPEKPDIPGEFDYGAYLRNQGYVGTVFIQEQNLLLTSLKFPTLRSRLNEARDFLLFRLSDQKIELREFGVISALVLGDRTSIDSETRNAFANAGVVHVLAVSGLHVGIIYLFFVTVFRTVFKDKFELMRFFGVLIILWLYAALTGFSPSVLRASTMFSFIALGKLNNRYGNIYNMIAASALILLLINPLLLLQVGFQLSYLAVVGIIFYFPFFYKLLFFNHPLLDKVWSLVCVSFSAQLVTFPLSVFYFGQFPNLFLITNLVVIPFATLILYGGILYMLLFWIPWLSDAIAFITIKLTWFMNEAIALINGIPFSVTDDLFISSSTLGLVYISLFSLTWFLIKPKKLSFWLLTGLLLFLATSYAWREVNTLNQKEIILLKDEKDTSVALITGNHIRYYSTDTILMKDRFIRRAEKLLLSKGIKKVKEMPIGSFSSLRDTTSDKNQERVVILIDDLREEVQVKFVTRNPTSRKKWTVRKQDNPFEIYDLR